MAEVGLALILAAVLAVSAQQTKLLADEMRSADTTADVLDTYRKALQGYTDENFIALQAGQPVVKNGVTLAPGNGLGQSMQPDIPSLITMAYLRPGFSDFALVVPGGKFKNQVVLSPAACVTTACNVDGLAWIDKPVLTRDGASVSSPLVGEMLSHLGGYIGMSEPGSANVITGSGGGWTWPNPVAGQPEGVVGARFGYDSSALGAFVRLNDTRDPGLRGDLSVQNNLAIGGTSTLTGAVTAKAPVSVVNAGGATCVKLDPSGIITIACAGTLNAITGSFTDGAGNTTTVSPTGVVTTGRISAAQGLSTLSGTVFDATDPNAITVTAGQQFFRGSSGALTLMTLDNGDVVAGKNVAAQRLALQSVAAPGAACANTSGAVAGAASEYASTATGGMVVCRGGTWIPLATLASANSACAPNGTIATDNATGGGLICKRGYYLPADSAMSNLVLGTPFQVVGDGFTVVKSSVIVCDAQGGGTGAPTVYILPQNETSIDSAFSRTATDSNPGTNAGTWTFSMKDGAGAPLTSVTAIAIPSCFY